MVAIDYVIQTSARTANRLPVTKHWTRHVAAPSTVRYAGDEQVGRGDYLSATEKTLYAIDTFKPHYDWLYVIDDDGYVNVRRLELRLIDLDPDEHHAIGLVHGKLTHEDAKLPALHGGCGFALSRATACQLQQMHWHGELVTHPRSSDATVSINLHRMRVIPTHDVHFTSELPTDDKFIACHRVLPTTPEAIIQRLNNEQSTLVEASGAKPNNVVGFSQSLGQG